MLGCQVKRNQLVLLNFSIHVYYSATWKTIQGICDWIAQIYCDINNYIWMNIKTGNVFYEIRGYKRPIVGRLIVWVIFPRVEIHLSWPMQSRHFILSSNSKVKGTMSRTLFIRVKGGKKFQMEHDHGLIFSHLNLVA